MKDQADLTDDYWPLYAVAGGVGTALGWIWRLRVACAFMAVVLLWMALWSFGAAGVVASSMFVVGNASDTSNVVAAITDSV